MTENRFSRSVILRKKRSIKRRRKCWKYFKLQGVPKSAFWATLRDSNSLKLTFEEKLIINIERIHPCESWGPEDFKTGIPFKNWPIMKPIPSKTRDEYQFSISAKGERKDKMPCIFSLKPSELPSIFTKFNFQGQFWMQNCLSCSKLSLELRFGQVMIEKLRSKHRVQNSVFLTVCITNQ